MTGGIR